MSTLSTLPEDPCLEIVDRLLESYDGHKNQIAGLRNLSLACTSLNFLCGRVIFRTYHLDIRRFHWKTTVTYPKGSTTDNWDEEAIKLRLAHLRNKAPFVRKIYITDQGETIYHALAPSEAIAFPARFMPELLSTLCMLKGLTSIHLVTHCNAERPNTVINAELWRWLLEVRPTTLSLTGHFEVPKGEILQPIQNLTMLHVHSSTNANRALVVLHKPRNISLTYSSKRKDCFPYKPDHCNLENISVEIDLQGRERGLTEPLFDFSKVPQATISVSVTYMFDYKRGAPTWQYLRPLLQPLFAEDLSTYDVRCNATGMVDITRSPKEGWEPVYQDHLEES